MTGGRVSCSSCVFYNLQLRFFSKSRANNSLFRFMFSVLDKVSNQSKDLICKLMEPDFTKRIDVDDVLRHPFFHECDSASFPEPPELSLIDNDIALETQGSYSGCVIN